MPEDGIAAAADAVLAAVPPGNPRPVTRREHHRTSARGMGRGRPAMTDVSAEQQARETELVALVLRSFEGCENPRLLELVQALTRHLHAFAREVRLSDAGVERRDRIPDRGRPHHRRPPPGVHPALGRARPVDADHRDQQRGRRRRDRGRPSSGPSSSRTAPRSRSAATSPRGAVGEPCWVEGIVKDNRGKPLAGARIEVWEADADGFYDVQYDDERIRRPRASVHRRPRAATPSGP